MKRIEKRNKRASNKSYTLGANAFSDITSEEFLATHTGYKSQPDVSQFQSAGSTATLFSYDSNLAVADSVDWRQQGAVTGIKNQEDCACCWAFASVAALEGIYQMTTGSLVSFSEQQLVDCLPYGCRGANTFVGFTYMEQQALETEGEYSYENGQGQCNAVQNSPIVKMYQQVQPNDVNALVQAVNQQPVAVGIQAPLAFHQYGGGIYDEGCGSDMNHAVTVIGYGTDETTGQSYWLIKNSWGETWGENGYMKLLMDENLCPITQAATFPVLVS